MINLLASKKLTLRIVAPSGAMEQPDILLRAVKRLKRMGLNVELDEQTALIHQRFAGTDEHRAAALERALLDPNVDIVMAECLKLSFCLEDHRRYSLRLWAY